MVTFALVLNEPLGHGLQPRSLAALAALLT
jgi:hypothetical protein